MDYYYTYPKFIEQDEKHIKRVLLFSPLSFNCHRSQPDTLIALGDRIIGGELVVDWAFSKYIDIARYSSVDDIDWDIYIERAPTTFSLYLHTLQIICFLTEACRISGDKKYLERAEQFIDSWINYSKIAGPKNHYTWYDHSVARRSEALVYFLAMCEMAEYDVGQTIIDLIEEHAQWLLKEENYTENHNHGIIEDGALSLIGFYFNNDSYVQTVCGRLDKQLRHAFPNRYVHVENSISYQIKVMKIIEEFYRLFDGMSHPYASDLKGYYDDTLDFLSWVYKPNFEFPFYGDAYPKTSKLILTGENKNLEFIFSQGEHGEKPSDIKVYAKDGYAFSREWITGEAFDQASWLMFKSGFISFVHKHKDDLAIVFYTKGHDIFIDPGLYNYMGGLPVNDYLISNFAHNTVIVDDTPYSISKNDPNKAGTTNCDCCGPFTCLSGFNNQYRDVDIDRKLVFIDQNDFFIIDDMVAENLHKYTQNFHLSEDVEIVSGNAETVVLDIKGTGWRVVMKQLLPVDSLTVLEGASDDPANMSVRPTAIGEARNTVSIRFNRRGTNERFVTHIRVMPENDPRVLSGNAAIIKKDLILYDQNQIDIASRARIKPAPVQVRFNGDEAEIHSLISGAADRIEYCYYLIDMNTGVTAYKTAYSKNAASINLEKGKNYAVISFLRIKGYERLRLFSGRIEGKSGSFSFIPSATEEYIPYVTGKEYEKLSGGVYRFTIETIGFHGIRISWLVYRNGVSVESRRTDDPCADFSLEQPGRYTVFFRAIDSYFYEVERSNFPSIIVP